MVFPGHLRKCLHTRFLGNKSSSFRLDFLLMMDLRTKSKRYVLFLQFEWIESIVDLVRNNIEDIFKQANDSCSDVHIAVVGKPGTVVTQENGLSWKTNLQEIEGVLQMDDVSNSQIDSNKIAEEIHGLADQFPTAGYHLDIIWPITIETVFPIENHLALFGALQRLKTWHNAHLTVATVQDSYSWSIDPWLMYLRGETKQLTRDCGNLLDWQLVWRGDLKFTDGKGIAAVNLPGFSLVRSQQEKLIFDIDDEKSIGDSCCDDEKLDVLPYDDEIQELTAFDRSLDVIHIVNLADVPGCLVSSNKFNLKITPGDRLPRTSNLHDWLVSEGRDQGMALLTRIGGTHAVESALINNAGDELKTTEWKKHMYQVPNVEFKGRPFALHLLLHGDEEGKCVARVMHSPIQVNADIHVKLATSQLQFNGDDNAGVSVIEDLPVYEGNQLLEIQKEVSRLQVQAIKDFLDLRVSEGTGCFIAVDELKELLTSVRKEYLARIESKHTKTIKQFMQDAPQVDLKSLQTEVDQDPSEWLERLFIHHKESVEKKMKRYKSSDMMLGGMVVKKCKDNTIRLDAEEFLRHFKPDGYALALEEALSPIGVIGGSNQDHQQDTHIFMDREQPFEELVKHKFADIRYCLDLDKAQKKEDHFAKMQQKLVWNETACTCTMEQAASPATMEIRSTGVKGQRKLTDSAKKKMLRGVKRKSEDAKSSQANKRRLLRGNAVEKTFVKPTTTPRVRRKSQSFESPRATAVRSSPRRQQASKIAGVMDDGKRRASTSSLSSSSKVTTVTFDAAGKKRPSRSSSLSSGGQKPGSSSGGQRSRKQKHTELLQGIVHDLLKDKGITKDHPIYPQCSKRLFATTKDYVRSLPPKSYSSLTDEMKSIASQNVQFVIGFEERLYNAKDKK